MINEDNQEKLFHTIFTSLIGLHENKILQKDRTLAFNTDKLCLGMFFEIFIALFYSILLLN